MREIKFRAWNRLNGKMYEKVGYRNGLIFIDYDYDEYDFECEGDIIINSNYILDEDTTEIMQYTGLKDKNGKEIYEGDILRQKVGNHYCFYEVIFHKGMFTTRMLSLKEYGQYGYIDCMGLNSLNKNTIEIIGNIYENPEILK